MGHKSLVSKSAVSVCFKKIINVDTRVKNVFSVKPKHIVKTLHVCMYGSMY